MGSNIIVSLIPFRQFFIIYFQCKKPGKNKRGEIRKEQAKLLLLADDMIIFIENLKESKKILKPISEFNKIGDFKVNIQK